MDGSHDAHEFEVTPEMIAAGARALSLFDPREDLPENVAAAIYADMEAVRRTQQPAS